MEENQSVGYVAFEIYQMLNILLPSIPFFFQVRKFHVNQSSVGFSRKLSLTIIMSSILRIFFWFGKRFHWSLLVQSILMSFMQIFVLHTAIKFREGNNEDKHKALLGQQNNKFYMLEWDNLGWYILFVIFFSGVLEGLSLIFTFQNMIYVETLGTLSSVLEAALVFPQIIENCRVKSCENLSRTLVGCWIVGDSMKAFYYYISEAPLQLLISGFVQIFLDMIIVCQVIIYRKKKVVEATNSSISTDATDADIDKDKSDLNNTFRDLSQ